MTIITREDILKLRIAPEVIERDSESLGGKVRFKKMAAAGSFAVEGVTTVFHTDGSQSRDYTYLRMAVIAFSQVDDNDRLIWSQADIKGYLSELPKDTVNELFSFAIEVNPQLINQAKQEDVKEDLEKNRGGSSNTD